MNAANLWSLTIAEIRSCRRLVRTWVFIVIASFSCVVQWIASSFIHAAASSTSAAASQNAPLFQIGQLGQVVIGWFVVGTIALVFDIRVRDERNRISEVVNSKPVSNLEFLTGRLMGVTLVLGTTATILILLMYSIGTLTTSMGTYFGGAIEFTSICAFLVWDIVPNLAFWGSLTILLAMIVRYRILVVLAMAAVFGAYFFINSRLPHFLSSILSLNSGINVVPSELAPVFVTTDMLINRVAVLLLSAGFLVVAAGLHQRQTSKRNRFIFAASGAIVTLVGAVSVTGLVLVKQSEQSRFEHWASLHAEYQDHVRPDIESISGNIDIYPGRSIKFDLVLRLGATELGENDALLFSLNPGYRISEIHVDGTTTDDYVFEDGLLRISQHRSGLSGRELRIVAKGKPLSQFAYLDSSFKLSDLNAVEVQALSTLGTESYTFHPQIVALLPGVSWLPAAGAAFGTNSWDARPQDFFELDIEVGVPRGWIVAGPGTRETVEQQRRTKFRFNPSNPVPTFALIGSKFERRSLNVNGIEFELLLSKKHTKNLRVFEDIGPTLAEWLQQRTQSLSDLGLQYPYGTLSFAEVPVRLRVYEGGWRAASITTQPGIQLIRESGFPIARFDNVLRNAALNEEENEQELKQRELLLLEQFFENDPQGGNPLSVATQNLVNYQTMPNGSGAIGLKYLVQELATNLTTNSVHYFSIYRSMNPFESIQFGFLGQLFSESGTSYGEQMRRSFLSGIEVWEYALSAPLSDLDYEEQPENAYHVLLVKVNAVADTVINDAERSVVVEFLSELVERYRGGHYTKEDFFQTALDVGLDFNRLVGDWLDSENLPGFIAGSPKTERLRDTPDGDSVYQTSFILRNDEPVPGNVNISYSSPRGSQEGGTRQGTLDPIRVEGNTSLQIAFTDTFPTSTISIEPLLALNRHAIGLELPSLDDYRPTDAPALPPTTKIDWLPPYADSVIVDDLDDGFSIIGTDTEAVRVKIPPILEYFIGGFGIPNDDVLDRGLPSTNAISLSQYPWSRTVDPKSYGKYRFTYATKRQANKDASASFKATLPKPGLWRLAFHVPHRSLVAPVDTSFAFSASVGSTGATSITVESEFESSPDDFEPVEESETEESVGVESDVEDQLEREIKLEVRIDDENLPHRIVSTEAVDGWNDIGQFEVSNIEVEVVVISGTPGSIVADAIKWTPVEE